MKRIVFFLLLFSLFTSINAQRNADFGVIGGTNFYLGDINQEQVFYKPGYNAGAIFRYNFDKRSSLRIAGRYAKISGSDDDFNQVLVGRLPNTFSTTVINFAAQAEYCFFDYRTGDIAYNWSPYLTGGIGYSVVISSSSTAGLPAVGHVVLPFGLGAKVNITRRLSGGVEWTFNKTFSDKIDGVVPPSGETFFFKNDWYNFVGLFITYKFVKFAVDCPAYN